MKIKRIFLVLLSSLLISSCSNVTTKPNSEDHDSLIASFQQVVDRGGDSIIADFGTYNDYRIIWFGGRPINILGSGLNYKYERIEDLYFIYDEGCGIYACKESGSTHEIYTLSKMYHHELLYYNQIKSIYRQYSRYIKNN